MKAVLITINSLESKYPPLGLYMISSYTKKYYPQNGIDININYFRKYNMLEIMKYIIKEKPDMIGMGCYAWNINQIVQVCEKVKKSYPKIKILLGGPSIDFNDESLKKLIECNIIDFAIEGEGERTFGELTDAIVHDKIESFSKINGLMAKDSNGKVFINRRAKKDLLDLNVLPNPYLQNSQLLDSAREYGCIFIEASRGCPYTCAYCVTAHVPFRYKDIDLVIQELKELVKNGVNNFCFLDGTVNFNIVRTKEMLKRIIKLNLKANFEFEIKAEVLDDELISLMKEAGVINAEIGLQSSNTNTLKLLERYYEKEKFEMNIKKLMDANIGIAVDLILGLPNETIEDWYNSIDYCYNLGNITFTGNVLKILPNSKLKLLSEQYGYKYDTDRCNRILSSNTMSEDMINFGENMVIVLEALWSGKDFKQLQPYVRDICKEYYCNKFSTFLAEITEWLYAQGINGRIKNLSVENKKILIKCFIMKKIKEKII